MCSGSELRSVAAASKEPPVRDTALDHRSEPIDRRSDVAVGRANDRRRWAALAVVCLAVFVTLLDGTIVNIALPSLAVTLRASNGQLQWVVDAYLLAFTGLLLASGSLGDRLGRRRTMVAGLVVFGATSAYAATTSSVGALITARALMGIGGALIFPATLAIITNLFTDPAERAKAIGAWTAVTGMAVAAGPIIGGWLIEHFWWGSIFLVNIPVTVLVAAGALALVPESKERHSPRFDATGLLASIAAIAALVYTIIEAPDWGWLSVRSLGGFAIAITLLAAFVAWELRVEHPMLPVAIFQSSRFTAASTAITAAYFALFGFVFLVVQYFQLVLGYSPLAAGIRTLPVAMSIGIASTAAPKLVHRLGTTRVVTAGLLLFAGALLWVGLRNGLSTHYAEIAGEMVLLGSGMGFATAPATESIMGSVSLDKAGVGSAVNDTTRELGSTLGVAVIGSVFSSIYLDHLRQGASFRQLPAAAQGAAGSSVGAAHVIARGLGAGSAPLLHEVNQAFVDAFRIGAFAAAGIAALGAVIAARFLPARAD
jgi:EmrB/QacA subfamily drug resistance transporter